LHEWVFKKAEIARAASASAISAFWKTHKCKLIPNWTRKSVWLLINNTNMKKFGKSAGRCFLKPLFSHSRKLFSEFLSKLYVIALHDIIGLQISHCISADHNPELRYVLCTGVTLFAPVSHFFCTCVTLGTALLSANRNRVIFSYVLLHW